MSEFQSPAGISLRHPMHTQLVSDFEEEWGGFPPFHKEMGMMHGREVTTRLLSWQNRVGDIRKETNRLRNTFFVLPYGTLEPVESQMVQPPQKSMKSSSTDRIALGAPVKDSLLRGPFWCPLASSSLLVSALHWPSSAPLHFPCHSPVVGPLTLVTIFQSLSWWE